MQASVPVVFGFFNVIDDAHNFKVVLRFDKFFDRVDVFDVRTDNADARDVFYFLTRVFRVERVSFADEFFGNL